MRKILKTLILFAVFISFFPNVTAKEVDFMFEFRQEQSYLHTEDDFFILKDFIEQEYPVNIHYDDSDKSITGFRNSGLNFDTIKDMDSLADLLFSVYYGISWYAPSTWEKMYSLYGKRLDIYLVDETSTDFRAVSGLTKGNMDKWKIAISDCDYGGDVTAHEIAHVFQYILKFKDTQSYNELVEKWEKLNPEGFQYGRFYSGTNAPFASSYAEKSLSEDISETAGITAFKSLYYDEITSSMISYYEKLQLFSEYFPTTKRTYENAFDLARINSFVSSNNPFSFYANNKLNVYSGSRVTSISNNGSSLTVNGYMFKEGVNCNKPNSIYREIIFVNEDDYSPSKAYRELVTPIYNTFLNKNATASHNGSLDLSYANYSVQVNINNISNYRKTSKGKMASGNYLIYMRISDGFNAYLFPLVDKELSDGTTLENTNKLGDNLSLIDSTSRNLRLTVK